MLKIGILCALLVLVAQASIRTVTMIDDFAPYAPLHPRWTVDTDPYNVTHDPAGGFFYTRASDGLAMMDGDAGAWLHLETPIGGTGDFSVYFKGRADSANWWGPSVTVYYDTDNFVSLGGWWDNLFERRAMVGGTYSSTSVAGGTYWNSATLKIEFDATTIKFYAKTGGIDETDVWHIPDFDMARPEAFTGDATMIIGKAYQTDTAPYDSPGMNNSYGRGAWKWVSFSGASYRGTATDPNQCGDPGTVYLEADLNEDCDVDLRDLNEFAAYWLCTDLQDPCCQ